MSEQSFPPVAYGAHRYGQWGYIWHTEEDVAGWISASNERLPDPNTHWHGPVAFFDQVSVLEKLESLEETLRSLAAYVGTGGFNADEVDAQKFEDKIRWGIDHIVSVERQRKPSVPEHLFLVTGTRNGYKERTSWTLTSWTTEAAAKAHVALLEQKLQEAADQVAEGCTTGLDYPEREQIESLMEAYDPHLELGTYGAGWSIEKVSIRLADDEFADGNAHDPCAANDPAEVATKRGKDNG